MRSSGVNHVDLVVSSIGRSLPFNRSAFEAGSRAGVNERADWLREQGAEIESGPEEYSYVPRYDVVFFSDPDVPGHAA